MRTPTGEAFRTDLAEINPPAPYKPSKKDDFFFYTERVGCTYRLVRMPVGEGSGGPPNAERS